jgi:PII-like signaling protein
MNQETPLQGVQLSFYCHTRARHDGVLMYEWLLERAKKNGIGGGSAFRAMCGFGRHGVLHEEQFFEAQAQTLLEAVRACGVDVVYAIAPASFAKLGKV